jgi:predicted nucleic acid-binding protein
MIYLDTSAFIKLYLHEEGSAEVHGLVVAQNDPLPVWHLTELEFYNALRFKVFLTEMSPDDVERLTALYLERKRGGQYFAPLLDPVALHDMSVHMTERTPHIGCRSLDILHVAAARLSQSSMFVTADKRQAALAECEGLAVRQISTAALPQGRTGS